MVHLVVRWGEDPGQELGKHNPAAGGLKDWNSCPVTMATPVKVQIWAG